MQVIVDVPDQYFLDTGVGEIAERLKRKVARLNNIKVTGSLAILLLAKHEELIQNIRPFLDRLCASDIHTSDHLIHNIMELPGELE